jgi:hypothetical protein
MPSAKGQSNLFAKALSDHARDETEYRQEFTKLPGGITGGIAQLRQAHIGAYKSGENTGDRFLYMAGVVIAPDTALNVVKGWKSGAGVVLLGTPKEMSVRGLFTTQTLPMCDRRNKGMAENVADALNMVRVVGGEECTAVLADAANPEKALEDLLKALVQAKPFFRFSTSSTTPSAEYPDMRVFENWHGSKGLENYSPASPNGAVQDQTPQQDVPVSQEAPEAGAEDPRTIEELVEAADMDESARSRLTQLAMEAGFSAAEIDKAKDWNAVGDMIQVGRLSDADDSPEEWKPEKGGTVGYKPMDKATKKPVKKAVQCEITVVGKDETVTLQNLENRKILYKSVPWSELIHD